MDFVVLSILHFAPWILLIWWALIRPQVRRVGKEEELAWQLYEHERGFKDIINDEVFIEGKKLHLVTTIRLEIISSAGKRAILLDNPGVAIHELNASGAASKRGPYYISRSSLTGKWRITDRHHLVQVLRMPGVRFISSNPYQRDGYGIQEKLVRVLEQNTHKRRSYASAQEFEYAPAAIRDAYLAKARSELNK